MMSTLLFVAVLSGYDMILADDGITNQMKQSINLFQEICINKFLDNSSGILFLNKVDLFTEKINNSYGD